MHKSDESGRTSDLQNLRGGCWIHAERPVVVKLRHRRRSPISRRQKNACLINGQGFTELGIWSGNFLHDSTDVSVDVGVIADLRIPGNCFTASALKTQGIHLSSNPCDFRSGAPAATQRFLFNGNAFDRHNNVIFLGSEEVSEDYYHPLTHYSVGSTKVPSTFTLNYSTSPVLITYNTNIAFNEAWRGKSE